MSAQIIPTIGLALGGGAARGFGHIPVIEAFDELGIRPSQIAGTSIGSIMGAGYASGMTGAEIREFVLDLFTSKAEAAKRIFRSPGTSLANLLSPVNRGLFKHEQFFQNVMPQQVKDTFEEMTIPLKVVATDFYSQEQVVLETGPTRPAVAASSALPGLLRPVVINDRVLIDGGFVNPTPFDVFSPEVDLTIGIDITGRMRVDDPTKVPSLYENIVGMSLICIGSILREKLKHTRPDILIHPGVLEYHAMEFFNVHEILAAAEPAKDELKRALEAHIENLPVNA